MYTTKLLYTRFTLQRIFSLALILILIAGMLPAPEMALAADTEPPEMTPGLISAIEEALGPDVFAPTIEDAKITASDGAAGDFFSYSISISGDTALVGAYENDDNGTASGSAYIFGRDQGGADNWGQVKKLLPSDGEANDVFGWSVAISGDAALVGAFGNGNDKGSAYLFERDQGGAGNWGEVKKLTASDGTVGELFGAAVAIDGDTLLIGAYADDDGGFSAGSAYIFERDQGGTGNWGQVKKLIASDIDDWDQFARAVVISGDTALVGSAGDDHNGKDSGSAYIFERNQGGANNWGETVKLIASDDDGQDGFGGAVAISGDTALLGARGNGDDGDFSGSAYFFERNQGGVGNWGEVTKLLASDAAAGDSFGVSAALSGETALVGAYGKDAGSGSAYIYSPYLDNGGFEDPLGAEWVEAVTANGDGRIPLDQAYQGSNIYLFKADGGLEIITQTLAQGGTAGDKYTLTFYFGGRKVDLSGKLGARLTLYNGGVKVNKKICILTPPSSTFSWAALTCTITAAGAFDSIEISIGILNVPSGMVGVDMAVLNKTGEGP